MPFEIQGYFKFPPLKIHYEIPALQAQKIRQEFYKEGLFPRFKDTTSLNVEEIHEFDNALETTPIDFTYSGGSRRKRLSDQVEESLYSKTEKMITKYSLLIPMALAIAEVWKNKA